MIGSTPAGGATSIGLTTPAEENGEDNNKNITRSNSSGTRLQSARTTSANKKTTWGANQEKVIPAREEEVGAGKRKKRQVVMKAPDTDMLSRRTNLKVTL